MIVCIIRVKNKIRNKNNDKNFVKHSAILCETLCTKKKKEPKTKRTKKLKELKKSRSSSNLLAPNQSP